MRHAPIVTPARKEPATVVAAAPARQCVAEGNAIAGMHYARAPVQRVTTEQAVVQRMVGEKAEGERVVARDDTDTVYIAQWNTHHRYDLFDEATGTYQLEIAPDDDDYILYDDIGTDTAPNPGPDPGSDGSDADDEEDEEDEDTPFSIAADQKKRRVYTHGPIRGAGGFNELLRADKHDFTYAEVSAVYRRAKKRLRAEDMETAVASGAGFALDDGPIPLDPAQDTDMQLVPFHILAYQKFHTPPTLKSAKRRRENPWRQEELEKTQAWLNLPGSQGLDHMLPLDPGSLREYYPGAIDVHYAPAKGELFSYGENKAIYKLNREMLLNAYLEGQTKEGRKVSERRRLTDAFYGVVGTQDGSVAEGDEQPYVRRTFGLKRTASESSMDEASSEEEVEDFDMSDTDAPGLRARKRKTYLNTLGVLVRLYNRKILEDLRLIDAATSEGARARAKANLAKHRGLLDKLEGKYAGMRKTHASTFKEIADTVKYVQSKTKLLEGLTPGGKEEEWRRRRYVEALDEYLVAGRGGSRPFAGIGKGTFAGLLEGRDKQRGRARHESDRERLDELARAHGGTLQYGSGDGNNCLIFAIANAVGHDIDAQEAARIRNALYRGNYAGVDRNGYLPATTRVVDVITQFVLGRLQDDDAAELPRVRVHILTVIPDIAPVVVGDGGPGDAQAYVIHDGGHYWWLKR